MLASSVLNTVTFKDLSGSYPNKWNTLHANRTQGAFTVDDYCQPFNKDQVIYLQFVSDISDSLTLKIYNPLLNATVVEAAASSYTGVDSRYFFNFEITLGSDYYDKKVTFTIENGTDNMLTSEPIYISDLSSDISSGDIKLIEYTNLDRDESDLDNYFIDWSAIDNTNNSMSIFVKSIDIEPNINDTVDILEGSQSKTIIAAKVTSGIIFKTGNIPDYFVEKLIAASGLDYFTINDIQYIKESSDIEQAGTNTLQQLSLTLSEKNTIGLNVDDLGIEQTDTMEWHKFSSNSAFSANIDFAEPDGYYTSLINIMQTSSSTAGTVWLKFGYTLGGDEIGEFPIYNNSKIHNITVNRRASFTAASRIYITVPSTAGLILEHRTTFQLGES